MERKGCSFDVTKLCQCWCFAFESFGDGLSIDDADRLTLLLKQRQPYRLLFLDALSISFMNGTTASFPHFDFPVQAGTGGVDVEVYGHLSRDVVAWFWALLSTTNIGFTNDLNRSFVYVSATPDNSTCSTRLDSMSDLQKWMQNTALTTGSQKAGG